MAQATRLALGTVQFGLNYGVANQSGQVAAGEVARIIARANKAGLDTLDTAIAYGDAEHRLGEAGVADWKVVTKLPPMPEPTSAVSWVRSQVNESMARLKVSSLYALMLHQPSALFSTQGSALFDALNELKCDGRVKKIGISAYGPDEIHKVISRFPIDIVQAPFNVIDRRMLESGCLAVLDQEGIEFHARSIFLQGLLLMDTVNRPSWFKKWAGLWAEWHAWLAENQLTPLVASLSFVASDPRVSRMVVGVDSLTQLNQIIRAVDGPMKTDFPAELANDDPRLINPIRWG
jgi:aryl-alcohol dehydrogenase-like predicted oxidoreductase